jgi:hypothetical protein
MDRKWDRRQTNKLPFIFALFSSQPAKRPNGTACLNEPANPDCIACRTNNDRSTVIFDA